MIWLILVAGGIGILLGLKLRMTSVLAASLAILATSLIVLPFSDWSFVSGAVFIAALITAVQFGYLLGLLLLTIWTRIGARLTFLGGKFGKIDRRLDQQEPINLRP
jgi:hypothetical protein